MVVRGNCRTNLPLKSQSSGWRGTQAGEPSFPVENSPLAHRQWVLIATPGYPQKAQLRSGHRPSSRPVRPTPPERAPRGEPTTCPASGPLPCLCSRHTAQPLPHRPLTAQPPLPRPPLKCPGPTILPAGLPQEAPSVAPDLTHPCLPSSPRPPNPQSSPPAPRRPGCSPPPPILG